MTTVFRKKIGRKQENVSIILYTSSAYCLFYFKNNDLQREPDYKKACATFFYLIFESRFVY